MTQRFFFFFLLRSDLKTEGLFRVSAKTREVTVYRDMIDNGDTLDMSSLPPHLLCGLIKSVPSKKKFFLASSDTCQNCHRCYLRELPEPVIPFSLYQQFHAVGCKFRFSRFSHHQLLHPENFYPRKKVQDEAAAVEQLPRLIQQLPDVNKRVLKLLMQSLAKVASFQEWNKMSIRNLAIVMEPNILRTASFGKLVFVFFFFSFRSNRSKPKKKL